MLVYVEGSISNKRIQNKTGQLVSINQIVVRDMTNIRIIHADVPRESANPFNPNAADEKQ